ncbi:MAG: hypothetical protein P0Y60_14575 [Candidatus Microbacterium colombiense]|nr:MAG: hypothetical protein P0Y60_14575 [Microbacterium sp.]
MRALLADGPDLVGRIRSLADPMKATPTDKEPGGGSGSAEAPAPVAADYIDALQMLDQMWRWWHVDIADYSNDLDTITWLSGMVLDHFPEVEGVREAWSVADAMAKWGPERRTRNEPSWFDPDALFDPKHDAPRDVPEWDDPIVGWADAAKLAGSDSTLRRWIKKGEIQVAGVFVIAGVQVRQFRAKDLIATRERLAEKRNAVLVQNAPAQDEGERS